MVQVFFVMLFFPVIMNALQYYIIDSFIKDQKPQDHEPISSEDEDEDDLSDEGRHDGAINGVMEENTIDGTEAKTADKDNTKQKVDSQKVDEYDPAIDGEGSGSGGEPDSPGSRINPGNREAAVKQ